mmetsp:Transcript_52677/g.159686  ORF Transcript_52677/g.159686 Transcript_52677/m.159686 type:complete len:205 (-) Transcript_52677:213-827(-)
MRVARLRLVPIEHLLQGGKVDRVPVVELCFGGRGQERHVDAGADVGEDARLRPGQERAQGPADEGHHGDVVPRQPVADPTQSREGVVGLRLAEGVDRVKPVTKLQAVLDEALPLPHDRPLLPVLEGHRVLEAAGDEGHGLAVRHQALDALGIRGLDGTALASVGAGEQLEGRVLPPEVWVHEPSHAPGAAQELRVEGAVDGPAR